MSRSHRSAPESQPPSLFGLGGPGQPLAADDMRMLAGLEAPPRQPSVGSKSSRRWMWGLSSVAMGLLVVAGWQISQGGGERSADTAVPVAQRVTESAPSVPSSPAASAVATLAPVPTSAQAAAEALSLPAPTASANEGAASVPASTLVPAAALGSALTAPALTPAINSERVPASAALKNAAPTSAKAPAKSASSPRSGGRPSSIKRREQNVRQATLDRDDSGPSATLAGHDADVELLDAMVSHLRGRDAAARPVKPATIARLVQECRKHAGMKFGACQQRICQGYWGRAQACPVKRAPAQARLPATTAAVIATPSPVR